MGIDSDTFTGAHRLSSIRIDVQLRSVNDSWNCLECAVWINGEPALRDPADGAFLVELVGSLDTAGFRDPFTCSCGDPGCGGYEPIRVCSIGTEVIWDRPPQGVLYRFEGEAYRRQVEDAVARARHLLRTANKPALVWRQDMPLFPEWVARSVKVKHRFTPLLDARRPLSDEQV